MVFNSNFKSLKQLKILILSGFLLLSFNILADPELPLLGEHSSLNIQKEVELGRGLYNKLKEKGYVIDNPLLTRYLQDIGDSLLATLDVRSRNYRFYLVKDNSVNAFAAPGGYIGVNIGLIGVTATEDELASVLAHEIAHIELMHSMQMIERAKSVNMASMISILAAILVGSQDAEAASAILYTGMAGSTQAMINFTRENEYEADRVGIDVLKKSEYDPQAMVEFMKILQSREQGGELAGIEYLRTHPVNTNRIAEITSRIEKLPQKKPKKTRYQQFRDYLFYLYPEGNSHSLLNERSEFSTALEHTKNGRFLQATEIYRKLLDSDPDSLWFNYAAAENLEYNKRLEEAAQVYTNTLLLYPDDLAIGGRLINVYLVRGMPHKALQIAESLFEKHKEQSAMYRLLVNIYTKLDSDSLRSLAEADFHWFNGNEKLAKTQYKALLSKGMLDAANAEKVKEKLEIN